MKSLEIVNQATYMIENAKGQKIDIGGYSLILPTSSVKIIKQDLEVLDIIRNKEIDIGFLKSILHDYSNEEALEIYNDYGYRKLTMKELLKLKQWLEVNENETKEVK